MVMRLIELFFGALILGFSAMTSAYEQPRYDVIGTYEDFEVRRYAPYLVAETDIDGAYEDGRNAAFRRLFSYITGNNKGGERIEMTVPVTSTPRDGSAVGAAKGSGASAPAAGVNQSVMQFMVPGKFSMDTVPEPRDPRVRIRKLDEQVFAVRRYSGRWTEENYRENEDLLRRQLTAAGLAAKGPSIFAAYNGPFTPWFLRRNEVMIPVDIPP
jgi:hypothetical protein